MAYKILGKASPGSATEAGGDDYDKFARIYQGQNLDSTDPIQTLLTTFPFGDNKLYIRNPANTFSYRIRSGLITAHRDINLPLLTAADTFTFNDHPATLAAKTLAAPILSNYMDISSTSVPASPGTNVLRVYRDPTNNTVNVKKSDGSIVDLEEAAAGGAPTDLNSLTDVVIATPATGDIMWHSGTQWQNLPRGTDNQVLSSWGSGTTGWEDFNLVDFETYARTNRTRKVAEYQLSTPTGATGLWSGFLTSVGTHSVPTITSSTGLRSAWTTGTAAGDQAGLRSTGAFTCRDNHRLLVFKIQSASADVQGFFGLVSGTSAFFTGADMLNAKHGIGVWFDGGISPNFRAARNDGTGATVITDFTNPTSAATTTTFEIRADPAVPNFTISQAGTNHTYTTDIPSATTPLFLLAQIRNLTAAATRFVDIRSLEWRGVSA